MNSLILAVALCGAPADYVLVVPPTPVVVRDYVLFVRPVRSVVVRRTVVTPPVRIVPAPRVIRYYDPPTYYSPPVYQTPTGFFYCPSCR